MSLIELKDRFMGIPWVYDTVRPLVVGSFDHEGLARFCAVVPTDRVFDLGCGTAQLFPYLRCQRYLGVDLDAQALQRARRYAGQSARFMQGDSWDDAYRELDPTVVLMIGLVHHISDEDFRSVVRRLKNGAVSLRRIVTFDSSYFPGSIVNNLLSRLDRGKYVRRPPVYEALFAQSGLRITRKEILPTRLGYARYIGYHLEI
jgi:SAM-dependent methyltransferase